MISGTLLKTNIRFVIQKEAALYRAASLRMIRLFT